MRKVKCVQEEYERLKVLFDNVDKNKAELVDELLKKAAFIIVEIDELEVKVKREGTIQYSNKGNTRQNPTYKTYLVSINSYQTIIKTLNSIMNNNAVDNDDEFDEFLKSVKSE